MNPIIDRAARRLARTADGVLVRKPLLDPLFPETSDLDFLAFADIPDLYPQRLNGHPDHGERSIDVTWLPVAWLEDPGQLAAHGLIAHRLVTSEPCFWRRASLAAHDRTVRDRFFDSDVRRRRVAGFFEMASLTVREVGVTWDFPALALFWLHMAYAACLAAAIEGRGRPCPNVFTQPFAYESDLHDDTGEVRSAWIGALRLDRDPEMVAAAVDRVHAVVSTRFPEPDWPATMRATTRWEYRYWCRPEEKQYRLAVAREMADAGCPHAAVHYLRFYVYAVARLPIVHARALEGRDVSFLRPDRALLPELRRLCPEILHDLDLILAGAGSGTDGVRQALATLAAFRERTVAGLCAAAIPVHDLPPWQPFERTARTVESEAPDVRPDDRV